MSWEAGRQRQTLARMRATGRKKNTSANKGKAHARLVHTCACPCSLSTLALSLFILFFSKLSGVECGAYSSHGNQHFPFMTFLGSVGTAKFLCAVFDSIPFNLCHSFPLPLGFFSFEHNQRRTAHIHDNGHHRGDH